MKRPHDKPRASIPQRESAGVHHVEEEDRRIFEHNRSLTAIREIEEDLEAHFIDNRAILACIGWALCEIARQLAELNANLTYRKKSEPPQ